MQLSKENNTCVKQDLCKQWERSVSLHVLTVKQFKCNKKNLIWGNDFPMIKENCRTAIDFYIKDPEHRFVYSPRI